MKLTKEQKDELIEARRIIFNMEWDKTDEGADYWNQVDDNLIKYTNQKDVCSECGREK